MQSNKIARAYIYKVSTFANNIMKLKIVLTVKKVDPAEGSS